MATINTIEDFLQALEANPSWREAVRARILGDELLRLPARFEAFAQEQSAFNRELRTMTEGLKATTEELKVSHDELRVSHQELKATTEELKAFNEEQRAWNANAEARFNRLEGDMGTLKGHYARSRTAEDAVGIASDMGLEHVRTLTREDLGRMVAGGNLDRDTVRSFRNADLVMEATDGRETRYVALEISFTADKRDLDRALRNAEIISRFTGKPAQAAIASVRNDRESAAAVESGAVYWHPLEDRTPRPE